MAFKLLDMAQHRWRRLDGAVLLPLVRAGSSSWTEFRNESATLNQAKTRHGKPPDRVGATHNI
jgi:hypothetical protein